jgi:hypothetical protein
MKDAMRWIIFYNVIQLVVKLFAQGIFDCNTEAA